MITAVTDAVAKLNCVKECDVEFWADVVGYEGFYQVSNLGNIRAINYHNQGVVRNLKTNLVAGYPHTILKINGEARNVHVHRLVAEAFIPNPDNKQYVNHKNGDRQDNRVENLEWVTCSENTLHKFHSLGYLGNGRKPVMCIETGEYFASITKAAKAYGVDVSAISQAITNGRSACRNHFRYATIDEQKENEINGRYRS